MSSNGTMNNISTLNTFMPMVNRFASLDVPLKSIMFPQHIRPDTFHAYCIQFLIDTVLKLLFSRNIDLKLIAQYLIHPISNVVTYNDTCVPGYSFINMHNSLIKFWIRSQARGQK